MNCKNVYGLLCGRRADEGRFSDVSVPSTPQPDDRCQIGVFSQQRAYCMYLLRAFNSAVSHDRHIRLIIRLLSFVETLQGHFTQGRNFWVRTGFYRLDTIPVIQPTLSEC